MAPTGVSNARGATAAFSIWPSALGGGHRHRTVQLVSHFLCLTTTISSHIYISDYSIVVKRVYSTYIIASTLSTLPSSAIHCFSDAFPPLLSIFENFTLASARESHLINRNLRKSAKKEAHQALQQTFQNLPQQTPAPDSRSLAPDGLVGPQLPTPPQMIDRQHSSSPPPIPATAKHRKTMSRHSPIIFSGKPDKNAQDFLCSFRREHRESDDAAKTDAFRDFLHTNSPGTTGMATSQRKRRVTGTSSRLRSTRSTHRPFALRRPLLNTKGS